MPNAIYFYKYLFFLKLHIHLVQQKSVSCPTAEIIGISDYKLHVATISSLKGHKSSNEPPPLANISTSANLFHS